MNSNKEKYIKYKINYLDPKISIFEEWFIKNGGTTNLDIISNEYGYATIANKDLLEDNIVLEVPRNIIITEEDCLKYDIWKSEPNEIDRFEKNDFL